MHCVLAVPVSADDVKIVAGLGNDGDKLLITGQYLPDTIALVPTLIFDQEMTVDVLLAGVIEFF